MALSTEKRLAICNALIGIVVLCLLVAQFFLFILIAGEPDREHPPTPAQEHLRFVVGVSSGTVLVLAAISAVALFNWRDNLKVERKREIKGGR